MYDMYVCMDGWMYLLPILHICSYVCICIHIYIYIHIHCLYVYTHMCIYVYTYIYMCIQMPLRVIGALNGTFVAMSPIMPQRGLGLAPRYSPVRTMKGPKGLDNAYGIQGYTAFM